MGVAARLIVLGPQLYESSRLLSVALNRIMEERRPTIVIASPPFSLEKLLWGFLVARSPYGVDMVSKRPASHFSAIARALVAGEREEEIVSGEISRLAEEARWVAWSIASSRSYTREQAALLLSYPAKLAAAVTAAALRASGVESVWFAGRETGILAAGDPLRARVDITASAPTLASRVTTLLERGVVPVLAGGVVGSARASTKLLGWGGEITEALTVASALNVREVSVVQGDKPLEPIDSSARCNAPEAVNPESLALAGSARILRIPSDFHRMFALSASLIFIGLQGSTVRVSEKGTPLVASRDAAIYSPGGDADYCPLMSCTIPGTVETAAGIPLSEAAYCDGARGRRLSSARLLVGPPETLGEAENPTMLSRLSDAVLVVDAAPSRID